MCRLVIAELKRVMLPRGKRELERCLPTGSVNLDQVDDPVDTSLGYAKQVRRIQGQCETENGEQSGFPHLQRILPDYKPAHKRLHHTQRLERLPQFLGFLAAHRDHGEAQGGIAAAGEAEGGLDRDRVGVEFEERAEERIELLMDRAGFGPFPVEGIRDECAHRLAG